MNLKIESGKNKAKRRKTEKLKPFWKFRSKKLKKKRERFFPERNKQKIK